MIERDGYTILDILSDVGGLLGILTTGIQLFLSILNHRHLDIYMASKLFKVTPNANSANSTATSLSVSTQVAANIKNFCIEHILPRKLVCCRQERLRIALHKAVETMEEEVDIIRIIRSRRFIHMALKHLLDPKVHKELELKSQFLETKLEDDDDDLPKPDSISAT